MWVSDLPGVVRKAQSYWINVSFTIKKSRFISSPARELTDVAIRADNRVLMKMMIKNLMLFPFSGVIVIPINFNSSWLCVLLPP